VAPRARRGTPVLPHPADVALREGKLEFGALTSSPAGRTAAGATIYYIAFDLLTDDQDDLREQPYRIRRQRLKHLVAEVEPGAPGTSARSVLPDQDHL
jgi:ATP-dependent DNA ligase